MLFCVGLIKLKRKLDTRLKAKELRSGRFQAMERVESTTSSLPPPKHPVKWAVSLTATSSEAVSVESSDTNEQFSLTRYTTVYIYIYNIHSCCFNVIDLLSCQTIHIIEVIYSYHFTHESFAC